MKAAWLLVACGIVAHALLLFVRSSHGIAGCGTACDDVLSSRWSSVAGIPVPWFGIATYLLTGIAFQWRKRALLATCLVLLGGAVVWFLVVQAFLLHRFCGWCLTAHVVALATIAWGCRELRGMSSTRWLLALAGGVTPMGAAILIQLFGPVPATHRIEAPPADAAAVSQLHAQGGGRVVAFDDGMKRYAVESLPRLGPADAKHVLVEYFDYQCPACRTMHGFLEALRSRHPREIAVIVLPVPLERSCNRLLGPRDTAHPGSCEISRAALAVWRAAPADFEEVHLALFADPQAGLRLARGKAPATPGDDPWIDALLRANAEDWIVFSSTTRHLPKVLVTNRRILHGLPSSEQDFLRVIERELGL